MLDRMSNDGSTPSASSTSLASSADGGNATPIMAASPAVLANDQQPLVSPDSLLEEPQLFAQPSAQAACPECEEELELVVEIRDNGNNSSSGEVSYVASMGPMGGEETQQKEEDSISDKEEKDTKSVVAAAAVEAAVVSTEASSENDLSEPAAAVAAQEQEAAPTAAAANEIDDEENSSEADYAKEEEPEVAADAHLMADIQFSQQKLHELLNQLEKQNRYPAVPSSAREDNSNSESPKEEKTGAEKESSPPPKEKSPSPKEASPSPAESSAADRETTPERKGSGDHEISDHIDRAKLRKCSSLKSGRTPPGTPGVRKIVR